MKKTGIIGAMDVELEFLRGIMNPPAGCTEITQTDAAGLHFDEGMINGVAVVVVKSGIGKVNAALCAQRLIMQFGVTHVINTGIAGAMAHGLGVLDMVVSTDAVYHDFDVTGFGYKPTVIPQMDVSVFPADKGIVSAVQKAYENLSTSSAKLSVPGDKLPSDSAEMPDFSAHKLIAGRIASGDQFISSRDVKKHIRDLCDPACVEMEGAAIAHACYLSKIPFAVIRCISDMADDGGEAAYKFNDKTAGTMSALVVTAALKMI